MSMSLGSALMAVARDHKAEWEAQGKNLVAKDYYIGDESEGTYRYLLCVHELPGCCGVMVSHDRRAPDKEGHRKMIRMGEEVARGAGYTRVLSTHTNTDDQLLQQEVLKEEGYHTVEPFVSRRTLAKI